MTARVSRKRSRGSAAICLAALCVISFGALAAPAAAGPAVITRGDTWDPSAGVDLATGGTFVSLTRYTTRGVPHAFLLPGTARSIRLNLRGEGWAWGMDAAASTVSFQVARHGDSNVRFYNWASGLRSSAVAEVNSTRWEYEPSLSGRWLVFARWNRVPSPDVRRLFLHDLATGSQTKLAEFAGGRAEGMLESPQVSGDWVVWTTWADRFTRSTVTRYRISTGVRDVVPAGRRPFDYLSAVGRDGTVYFLRSGSACGSHVTLRSYTTGGVMSTLATLPAGRDGGDEMFAETLPDGSTDLYFDTFRCSERNANGDIWRLSVDSNALAASKTRGIGGTRAVSPSPKRLPSALRRRLAAITGGAQ